MSLESIQNADKLLKKLDSIDSSMQNEILENVVKNANFLVRKQARLLINSKTGELSRSIKTKVENDGDKVEGTVYTKLPRAVCYEFGTGPNGEADHQGISPEVSPKYSQTGWMIPGDAMKESEAREYGFGIARKNGEVIGYYTKGMAARPFMYPALHDQKENITKYMQKKLAQEIGKGLKK